MRPPRPAATRGWRVLGLTIDRKTDLLAATAFLLALLTTIYQFVGFVRGAALTLYPPDRVIILSDRLADGRTIVRVIADLTVVNDGQPGRDAVLRDIDATISIDGGLVSRQRWLSFPTVERDDTTLKIVPVDSAHPLQVAGGAAVSHTVSFSPLPEGCRGTRPCAGDYVAADDFAARLLNGKSLGLSFEARAFPDKELPATTCRVTISDALILNLTTNGWHSAACVAG